MAVGMELFAVDESYECKGGVGRGMKKREREDKEERRRGWTIERRRKARKAEKRGMFLGVGRCTQGETRADEERERERQWPGQITAAGPQEAGRTQKSQGGKRAQRTMQGGGGHFEMDGQGQQVNRAQTNESEGGRRGWKEKGEERKKEKEGVGAHAQGLVDCEGQKEKRADSDLSQRKRSFFFIEGCLTGVDLPIGRGCCFLLSCFPASLLPCFLSSPSPSPSVVARTEPVRLPQLHHSPPSPCFPWKNVHVQTVHASWPSTMSVDVLPRPAVCLTRSRSGQVRTSTLPLPLLLSFSSASSSPPPSLPARVGRRCCLLLCLMYWCHSLIANCGFSEFLFNSLMKHSVLRVYLLSLSWSPTLTHSLFHSSPIFVSRSCSSPVAKTHCGHSSSQPSRPSRLSPQGIRRDHGIEAMVHNKKRDARVVGNGCQTGPERG